MIDENTVDFKTLIYSYHELCNHLIEVTRTIKEMDIAIDRIFRDDD